MAGKTDKPADGPSAADIAFGVLFEQMMERMMERDLQLRQQFAARNDALQDQLIGLFSRIADATGVDHVLVQGLGSVSDQLATMIAPLRQLGQQLGQQVTPLSEADDLDLAALHDALRRPDSARSAHANATILSNLTDLSGSLRNIAP
jgi:hypothetical protein